MSRSRVVVGLLFIAAVSCATAISGELPGEAVQIPSQFKLRVRVGADTGGQSVTVEGHLYFIGTHVFEFEGDATGKLVAAFDLGRKQWYEVASRQLVDMQQANEWVRRTEERSMQSLTKPGVSEETKRLVKLMIAPNFQVTADGNEITMRNEIASYRIVGRPIATTGKVLFDYERLNAYRKAMVLRKFPPHMNLAITAELEKRSLFPAEVSVTLTLPKNSIAMKLESCILPLSAEEAGKVDAAVKNAGVDFSR